ncbi:hypothetical protein ACOTJS_19435 [Achromobacter xylosoxidans]
MEEPRHYATGQNFKDPAVIEEIGKRYRDLPGILSFLISWALFTAASRAVFESWELCGLVGIFGASIRHLFVQQEKFALEQRQRDETTRAMIRELNAEFTHRIQHLDERVERVRDILLDQRSRSSM